MEKPKEQTPDEMLQEQVEILEAMRELAKLPDDDGDLYTDVDVQDQAKLVAEIIVIHERLQVLLGRQAASDLALTVSLPEVA